VSLLPPIEYDAASAEVRAVYDEIKAARGWDDVNNIWKLLAHHPPTLRAFWDDARATMAPGALDPLTKELVYVAVSMANACRYCITTHTASARSKGLTDAAFGEFLAVVALAAKGNQLVSSLDPEVDARFLSR